MLSPRGKENAKEIYSFFHENIRQRRETGAVEREAGRHKGQKKSQNERGEENQIYYKTKRRGTKKNVTSMWRLGEPVFDGFLVIVVADSFS